MSLGINFGILQSGGSVGGYLLDTLTNPPDILGSHFRAHSSDYDTINDIIKIRRTSDGSELDFNGSEITNNNDTSWVGSQTSYVRKVYDQSGNGKDLGTATAGYQQQWTDSSGGRLTLDNGNPSGVVIPFGPTFPALGFTNSNGAIVIRLNGNTDTGWQLLRASGPTGPVSSIGSTLPSVTVAMGSPTIEINGTSLSPYTRGQFYTSTTSQDATIVIRNINWGASANWNSISPYIIWVGNAKISEWAFYNTDPGDDDITKIKNKFETV